MSVLVLKQISGTAESLERIQVRYVSTKRIIENNYQGKTD
jgi:hypothetical protein